MLRYFTFDGQTSKDNDIIVNRIQRPILPELRERKLIIPGKDGAWDFGNNTYEESEIVIECTLIKPLDKRSLIRLIAKWLSVKSNLILSDEPDKYYFGRGYASFKENISGAIGEFTLNFIVDPFAYSIVLTTDEILLGDDVPLGSDIQLGNSSLYEISLSGPDSIDIDNFGTKTIRPAFIMNGSFDSITISVGGKNLTYGSAITSQILNIDCLNYTAELDGINKLSELSGDTDTFLSLDPGTNIVTITGTNLNFDLKVEFRPEFY